MNIRRTVVTLVFLASLGLAAPDRPAKQPEFIPKLGDGINPVSPAIEKSIPQGPPRPAPKHLWV